MWRLKVTVKVKTRSLKLSLTQARLTICIPPAQILLLPLTLKIFPQTYILISFQVLRRIALSSDICKFYLTLFLFLLGFAVHV